MKLTYTVEISDKEVESFIQDLGMNVDLFRGDYIGDWAYGLEKLEEGFIMVNIVEYESRKDKFDQEEFDHRCEQAVSHYKKTKRLKKHFHLIDREVLMKAIKWMVKENRWEDYDGVDVNWAIQHALFGEVHY